MSREEGNAMRAVRIVIVIVLLLLSAASAGVDNPRKVLRVSDGRVIAFGQMVEDLKNVSVVFVGEIHDDAEHHAAQLHIIRAFHESDRPTAIGLEMFRADSQQTLNSWVQGRLPVEKFLVSYYDNWGMPWALYRGIFLYARDHELHLQGLNIADGISKKIAAKGFGSLTAAERKQLPPGISCSVDPKYMEFIRRAYADHAGHRGQGFENFCEAQMVWDKTMAWHLMGYLRKNPDTTMVVLAGVGHAWKRGISEQLDEGITYRVVLPSIPNQVEQGTVTTADADYVLL
jgi:uncharacterized iron-regulated protein